MRIPEERKVPSMFISEILSKKISEFLFKQGLIKEEEEKYYAYIYSWLIDYIMFFVSLIVIGAIIRRFIPAVIFCFSFSFLRMTAGGAHASSRLACFIISFVFYFSVILFYSYIPIDLFSFLKFFLIIPFGVIVLLAPVDNPKKRLSSEQKKRLKILNIIVCSLIIGLLFILHFLKRPDYCNIIILCVIILPVDLIIGFIISKKGNR